MDEKQFQDLVKQVGEQAALKIKQEMSNYEAKAKEIAADAIKNGGITKEQFEEYQNSAKQAVEAVKAIAEKQGMSITQLQEKLSNESAGAVKSIAEVLKEDEEELRQIHGNGVGYKEYIITVNSKGQFVMKPKPVSKAAGPHGTIGDIGTSGNVSSVLQNIDSASLLRVASNAPIISQYRNTPWILDLVNVQNASMEGTMAIWFEEQVKQGGATTVVEGSTSPNVQYQYTMQSKTYKKKSVIISMTDEFSMDFVRLQSDILGKGRVDLINAVNDDILSGLLSDATAYNTQADFGTLAAPNDFHVLAAMAAQVDSATFGANANSAVMSTFKKYRLGTTTDADGNFINKPSVLDNLALVGNPGMTSDAVLVGDFMNYNVILRGGLILRVGHNGSDLANGMFSTVLTQYYYNYITNVRKAAIVKGADFATVKALITNP